MGFGELVQSRDDVPVSDTQSYKQFGNAVVPAVVHAVGSQVLEAIASHMQSQSNGCLLKGRSPSPRKRKASRRKTSKAELQTA